MDGPEIINDLPNSRWRSKYSRRRLKPGQYSRRAGLNDTITFSNESLDEHAAGPTTSSPDHDRFPHGDHGHDGIVSEWGHLGPMSAFLEITGCGKRTKNPSRMRLVKDQGGRRDRDYQEDEQHGAWIRGGMGLESGKVQEVREAPHA